MFFRRCELIITTTNSFVPFELSTLAPGALREKSGSWAQFSNSLHTAPAGQGRAAAAGRRQDIEIPQMISLIRILSI